MFNGIVPVRSDFTPVPPAEQRVHDAYSGQYGSKNALSLVRLLSLDSVLRSLRDAAIKVYEKNWFSWWGSKRPVEAGPDKPKITLGHFPCVKPNTRDVQYIHSEDLNEVVKALSWVPQGETDSDFGFATHSAIPVLSLYLEDVEKREDALVATTLARSSGTSVPAEVLPGELICKDHVIRRETAIKEPEQAKAYENARKVSIGVAKLAAKDGKMVVWRPAGFNCDYALIIEEGASVEVG